MYCYMGMSGTSWLSLTAGWTVPYTLRTTDKILDVVRQLHFNFFCCPKLFLHKQSDSLITVLYVTDILYVDRWTILGQIPQLSISKDSSLKTTNWLTGKARNPHPVKVIIKSPSSNYVFIIGSYVASITAHPLVL